MPHKATSAKGGRERMTMVTSWRPRSPHMKDATIMRGTRNTSHLPTLYNQYTEYRLANLVQRVQKQLKDVEDRKEADSGFDPEGVRGWLLKQRSYIDDMLREIQAVQGVLTCFFSYWRNQILARPDLLVGRYERFMSWVSYIGQIGRPRNTAKGRSGLCGCRFGFRIYSRARPERPAL